MRRLALALLATVAFAQVASAADLPVRAPAYKAAPMVAAWSWTGLYIGLNAGYSVGRDTTDQTAIGPGLPGGSLLLTSDVVSPAGFVGGAQIGYNWQMAPNWVWGVEVDFQGTGQKDTSCSLECGPDPLMVTQKLPWFGTARLRLGYTTGDSLWYLTAGGAWAQINSDFLALINPPANTGSSNRTKGGFAAGVGVETHLAGNWSAKFEYLFLGLGTISDTYATPSLGAGLSTRVDSRIRDHIIRVGLNYKLMP